MTRLYFLTKTDQTLQNEERKFYLGKNYNNPVTYLALMVVKKVIV